MKKPTLTTRVDINPRPSGTLIIRTLYGEDNEPEQVFLRFGKNGSQEGTLFEFLGRLITMLLELGVTVEEIKKQAEGMVSRGLPALPEVMMLQIKPRYEVCDE